MSGGDWWLVVLAAMQYSVSPWLHHVLINASPYETTTFCVRSIVCRFTEFYIWTENGCDHPPFHRIRSVVFPEYEWAEHVHEWVDDDSFTSLNCPKLFVGPIAYGNSVRVHVPYVVQNRPEQHMSTICHSSASTLMASNSISSAHNALVPNDSGQKFSIRKYGDCYWCTTLGCISVHRSSVSVYHEGFERCCV